VRLQGQALRHRQRALHVFLSHSASAPLTADVFCTKACRE